MPRPQGIPDLDAAVGGAGGEEAGCGVGMVGRRVGKGLVDERGDCGVVGGDGVEGAGGIDERELAAVFAHDGGGAGEGVVPDAGPFDRGDVGAGEEGAEGGGVGGEVGGCDEVVAADEEVGGGEPGGVEEGGGQGDGGGGAAGRGVPDEEGAGEGVGVGDAEEVRARGIVGEVEHPVLAAGELVEEGAGGGADADGAGGEGEVVFGEGEVGAVGTPGEGCDEGFVVGIEEVDVGSGGGCGVCGGDCGHRAVSICIFLAICLASAFGGRMIGDGPDTA